MEMWDYIAILWRDFLRQDVQLKLFGARYDLGYLEFGIILGIISLSVALIFNSNTAPLKAKLSKSVAGFFSVVFVAPVIEEIIFRLVLISIFTVLFESVLIAVVVSAFFFAVGHILWGNLRFVDTFVSGLLWGWAFTVVGLSVTIIAHMTHNFLASIMRRG
ncbi:MAG: CPBP family intramembrane glutamic endopeptidase [archaeon]